MGLPSGHVHEIQKSGSGPDKNGSGFRLSLSTCEYVPLLELRLTAEFDQGGSTFRPRVDASVPVAERATVAVATMVAMFKELICLIMSYFFRVGFPRYEQFAATIMSWRLDEWLSNTIFRSIRSLHAMKTMRDSSRGVAGLASVSRADARDACQRDRNWGHS